MNIKHINNILISKPQLKLLFFLIDHFNYKHKNIFMKRLLYFNYLMIYINIKKKNISELTLPKKNFYINYIIKLT